MPLPDPQFARSEVLRIFNHAQVYYFLGAAFITVGLVAFSFSILRRRFDPFLLWFAAFATLYGLRLDMNYQLLWSLGLEPFGLRRIVVAISYLIPIPVCFIFRRFNLLGPRGQVVFTIAWVTFLCLALTTLIFGPLNILHLINNAIVFAGLVFIVITVYRKEADSADVLLARRGLLVFAAGTLYDQVTGVVGHFRDIEPFGFMVWLACLGVVVGRRTLMREQQLSVIQKELEIAQRIQLSILPGAFPASRSFGVTARYVPMTTVAGDFYDFLVAGDEQAGLLIADVSGHGVPAALIASMVKLAATSERKHAQSPSALLDGMNRTLCGNTQGQFVTAGYVYLDAASAELHYSAAGHPPMLLLRAGQVIPVAENGLMLAAFDFACYSTLTFPIAPGDRLVLYTDGMLEATNTHEEEFGADRLAAAVQETAGLSHTDAADRILASVQRWSAAQNDDMTILLCDYLAQPHGIA